MEKNLEKSPRVGYPNDVGDAKYVSGLSTILVATIQEAKDRISQIEYIFCSQLFPNFQSKSKSLQKTYSNARKAAEDSWKEKESDLLLQLERLQLENKLILEENQSLKLENARFASKGREPSVEEGVENKPSVFANGEKISKELEEKNTKLLKRQRTLEVEAMELRRELMKKSKEVDEGFELHNRLLQLVQSKATVMLQKEKQLKEQEEKKNELLVQIERLGEDVNLIQERLCAKGNEVMKEKELNRKLLSENESYRLKNLQNEQLLVDCETEKQLLKGRIQSLEESVSEFQKELQKKNEQLDESRKLQEQYLEHIDLNTKAMLKTAQQLEELEKDNKTLVKTRIDLKEKLDKLEEVLRESAKETSKGMELQGKLLQQIEEKNSDLQSEKKKRRDAIAAYKNLKSQYNFLREKFGLTTESLNCLNKMEDGSNSKHCQNSLSSPDNGFRATSSMVPCEINKDMENSRDDEGVEPVRKSSSGSPLSTSNLPIAPMDKSGSLAGTKRSKSSWRDTRSHQRRVGLDPHDSFLDTPLENIIENIKNPSKEKEVQGLPDLAPTDVNFDSSGDETQELNGDIGPHNLVPGPGIKNGYKYTEPTRKRAERENLKGIQCKQCSKFYDAILPDGGGDKQSRCEHHDGVSRHRYRYAPPLTPEGFWNIGFESEM